MPNLNNLKICKTILEPSAGEHGIIYNQFVWRTEKQFIGENAIEVFDIQEPIWWNRPLYSDTFCKLEDDGLYSYNLPYCGGTTQLFKTNYNFLLNKHSVPMAAHIKLDGTWTEEDIQLLARMCQVCAYEALLDLGVSKKDMSIPKNDLTFQGRKFAGGEYMISDGVYSEDFSITFEVRPEQDIFNRLTGQYAHKRAITGITEEVPSITKEVFMEKLLEKLNAYADKYFR